MSTAAITKLRVQQGGRIIIPAWARKRLGLKVGACMVLTVQADHATLTNARVARRNACGQVRRYVRGGVSLSGELMAERKAEAQRE